MKISLSLFSIINNDAHISGTNLEGHSTKITISFLKEFLTKSKNQATGVPKDFINLLEKNNFLKKIDSLLESSQNLERLTFNHSDQTKQDRHNYLATALESTAKKIMELTQNDNDSFIYEGGWLTRKNTPTDQGGGHAMMYEFKKDKNGDYLFIIHNTGSGLNYHPKPFTTDKDRFNTIKVYKIPKNSVNPKSLSNFLAELSKPNLINFYKDLKSADVITYNAKILYNEVIPKIAHLNGKEISISELPKRYQEIISMPQHAGTCAQKILHELVKTSLPNNEDSKEFVFHLKKYSIDQFYQQNKNSMSKDKAEQLTLAIENLARSLLKQKDRFSIEFKEKHLQHLNEIKKAIENHTHTKQNKIIDLTFSQNIEKNNIQIKTEEQTLRFTKNKKQISPPSYLPPLREIQSFLDKDSFSQSKFIEIFQLLESSHKNQKSVDTSIEKLFLNFKLDHRYVRSIKNQKDARIFIESLVNYLNLYYLSASKSDPKNQFEPRRILTLLSIIAIINEVSALYDITSFPTIDHFYEGQLVDTLKSWCENPLLATLNPSLDKRLFEIKDRIKKTDKHPLRTNEYSKKTNPLDMYCDLLNKHPNSFEIKQKLKNIYLDKVKPNLDNDAIEMLRNSNYEIVYTLLNHLNQLSPEEIKSIGKIKGFTKLREQILLDTSIYLTLWGIHYSNVNFNYLYLDKDSYVYKLKNPRLVSINKFFKEVKFNTFCTYATSLCQKLRNRNFPRKDTPYSFNFNTGRKWYNSYKESDLPNFIYCDNTITQELSKGNINENTVKSAFYNRIFRLLHSSANAQILTTTDFFKNRPELISDPIIFKIMYFYIFQPGLITKGIQTNQYFYSNVNSFFETLIKYYQKESDASNIINKIIDMKIKFNKYILDDIASPKEFKALAAQALLEINTNKNLKSNTENLNLIFESQLALLISEKLEHSIENLQNLLDIYIKQVQQIKQKNDISDADLLEFENSKFALLNLMNQNKSKLHKVISVWLKQQNIDSINIEELKMEEVFPNIIFKDSQKNIVINMDFQEGEIWINGETICLLPSKLKMNPIFESFFKDHPSQIFKVSTVSLKNQNQVCRRFNINIPDSKQCAYYFETGSDNADFVLHYPKMINNSTSYFELSKLKLKNSILTSSLGNTTITARLPRTFFCKSTLAWRDTNEDRILIERNNQKFIIDSSSIVHELNSKGEYSGYKLVDLYRCNKDDRKEKAKKPNTSAANQLTSLFKHFEDPSLIEIFYNESKDQPYTTYKINFPRYNIELKAEFNKDTQKWEIFNAKDSDLIFIEDQGNPIDNFKGPMVFKNKKTKEVVSYIPLQEFSLEEGTNKDTTYPKTKLNTSLNDKFEPKRKNNAKKENNQVKLVNSEGYLQLKIDPKINEFMPQNKNEQLYLAYLFLNNHQPKKALSFIQEIIKSGGLKGSKEELAIIKQICSPEKIETMIKSPATLSLRLHCLYLISHYRHLFNTNISIQLENSSSILANFEKWASKKSEEAKKFQKSFESTVEEYLMQYNQTRNNVSHEMRLSDEKEYELLNTIFNKDNPAHGILGIRFEELKSTVLAREKQLLDDIAPTISPYHKRPSKLLKKLESQKPITITSKVLSPKTICCSNVNDPNRITTQLSYQQISKKIRERAYPVKHPHHNMSELEFITQFNGYLSNVLGISKNIDINQIKQFCLQTISANLKAGQSGQSSLIYNLSCVLLKAINHPKQFSNWFFTDKKEYDYFYHLLAISSNLPDIKLMSLELEPRTKIHTVNRSKQVDNIKPSIRIKANSFSYPKYSNTNFIKNAEISEFIKKITTIKQEKESIISKIKETNYPKNTRYEINEPQKSKIDAKIGQVEHQFKEKLKLCVQKNLACEKLRTKILTCVNKTLNPLNDELEKLLKDIIILANKGPNKKSDNIEFKLNQTGNQIPKLTLNHLLSLYLRANLIEYQNTTGLSKESCLSLHQKIADYMELSILKQLYENRKKKLLACQSDFQENPEQLNKNIWSLGCSLMEENSAQFSGNTELQLFQMAQNLLVYPSRIESVNKLLERDPKTGQFKNNIIQAIMGGGKSKIIAPLVNILKADGTNLVIHQVKRSLFNTNYQDLNQTSLKEFSQEAIPFQFDRHSSSSSKDFKNIFFKLRNTMVEKKYLVTTAESLQALELKYIELLLDMPTNKNFDKQEDFQKNLDEWNKQIKWLDRCLQLIKYQGDRIIDEIHDELDPKKRLNYTLGDTSFVSNEDIRFEINMYRYFKTVDLKQSFNFTQIMKNNEIVQSDTQWNEIFEELAKQVITDKNSPLKTIIDKIKPNKSQTKDLIEYLLDRSDSILSEFSKFTKTEKDQFAFYKMQISKLLPHTLKRNLFEHYGPSQKTKKDILDKYLPIPYSDNNTPNESSQFGHYIEYMNFTVQMAHQLEFSDELVKFLLDNFINDAKSEMIDHPNLKFKETISNIKFCEIFPKISLEKIKLDKNYRLSVIDQIRNTPAFIDHVLEQHILGKVTLNPSVISSNPVNLVSMTRTTQGMTGTPYNVLAMHRSIQFDDKAGLGIDGQTTELCRIKNPITHSIGEFKTVQEFLTKCKTENTLRAIVDVGALFKGISNEQVAKEIAVFYNNQSKIKYVLHFSTIEKKLQALEIKTGNIIELNASSEKEISKILKCTPNERFTYYDQANSTGTDILQDKVASAICTLSKTTSRSKLYQGIRRMRGLDGYQTFSLVYPDSLKEHPQFVDNDPMRIIEYTKHVEEKSALKDHYTGIMQNYKDVIRVNLLEKIYQKNSSFEKAQLMKKFEKLFVNNFHPDHFKQYGQITRFKESSLFFKHTAQQFFSIWMKTLEAAHIKLSQQESTKIKDELDLVTQLAIKACASKIETNLQKGESLGAAVEVENNLKIEVDVETETKIAIDLELETFRPSMFPKPLKDSSLYPLATIDSLEQFYPKMQSMLKKARPDIPFTLSSNLLCQRSFFKTEFSKSNYFDIYTKQVEVIMMVAPKDNPTQLKAVLLNKNNQTNQALVDNASHLNYPNHHVWFTTPGETLLGGNVPKEMPESYFTLMEQIRYLNGDCKLLAGQKHALSWVNDRILNYFQKKILPLHPDQYSNFKTLEKRLSVLNKIYRYILQNPLTDHSLTQWETIFPGAKNIDSISLKHIQKLNAAFKTINVSNPYKLPQSWINSFPSEIRYFIQNRLKSKIKEYEFRPRFLMQLEQMASLQNICHAFPNIDTNFYNHSKCTPLMVALSKHDIENTRFLVNKGSSFSLPDSMGNTSIDYLRSIYFANKESFYQLYKVIFSCLNKDDAQSYRVEFIQAVMKSQDVDQFFENLFLPFVFSQNHLEEVMSLIKDKVKTPKCFESIQYIYNVLEGTSPLSIDKFEESLKDFDSNQINQLRTRTDEPLLHSLIRNSAQNPKLLECIEVLLRLGIDQNLKKENNQTPLSVAIQFNQPKAIDLLLKYNANPNIHGPTSAMEQALLQLPISNDIDCFLALVKNGVTNDFKPSNNYYQLKSKKSTCYDKGISQLFTQFNQGLSFDNIVKLNTQEFLNTISKGQSTVSFLKRTLPGLLDINLKTKQGYSITEHFTKLNAFNELSVFLDLHGSKCKFSDFHFTGFTEHFTELLTNNPKSCLNWIHPFIKAFPNDCFKLNSSENLIVQLIKNKKPYLVKKLIFLFNLHGIMPKTFYDVMDKLITFPKHSNAEQVFSKSINSYSAFINSVQANTIEEVTRHGCDLILLDDLETLIVNTSQPKFIFDIIQNSILDSAEKQKIIKHVFISPSPLNMLSPQGPCILDLVIKSKDIGLIQFILNKILSSKENLRKADAKNILQSLRNHHYSSLANKLETNHPDIFKPFKPYDYNQQFMQFKDHIAKLKSNGSTLNPPQTSSGQHSKNKNAIDILNKFKKHQQKSNSSQPDTKKIELLNGFKQWKNKASKPPKKKKPLSAIEKYKLWKQKSTKVVI